MTTKKRLISTQFQDLDRGSLGAGRAKYPCFSWLASTGLLFASISFGLGVPLASAYAFDFSYFNILARHTPTSDIKAKPQNSQTIAFLEATASIDPKRAIGGGDIIMDDKTLSAEVGPSGTIGDIESSDHQGNVILYVVRSGDTIPQIAKMFDLTVDTVLWANDLSRGTILREGQHLVILPIDGVQHTVKKGDTLKSVAKKYNGDIDEILEFNDMKADEKLSVGDTVIIPNGKEVVTPTSGVAGVSPSRTTTKYPSYVGYYTHPVPSAHKTQGIHGNNGVDYGAPKGTPVYAAAEGVVIVSNFRTLSNPWFSGYGNYIMIEHSNGTKTLYGHLSAVYVAVGARVDQGQPIGEVGSTGKSTGPHLHFEVRGAKNPF